MGFFGMKQKWVPPHPREEPRIKLPLSVESLQEVFHGCVDFTVRPLELHGDPERVVTLCFVSGMVRLERACDYLLKPLAQSNVLADCTLEQAYERIRKGGVYDLTVSECKTMDEAVAAMINGDCLLVFEQGKALSFSTGTEEKALHFRPGERACHQGGQGFLCREHPHQHQSGAPPPAGSGVKGKGADRGPPDFDSG